MRRTLLLTLLAACVLVCAGSCVFAQGGGNSPVLSLTVAPNVSDVTANCLFDVNASIEGLGENAQINSFEITVDDNDPLVTGTNANGEAKCTSSAAVKTAFPAATLVDYLKANDDGSPKRVAFKVRVEYVEDTTVAQPVTKTVQTTRLMTIHDADTVNHGGVVGDRDALFSYPMGAPSRQSLLDPLTTDAGSATDDDGASSSYYTFSVHYRNEDALPPLLWFNGSEGVAMYIARLTAGGDYVNPGVGEAVVPNCGVVNGGRSGSRFYTNSSDQAALDGTDGRAYSLKLVPSSANYYEGLRVGRYHYFFAASDDLPAGLGGVGDLDFRLASPTVTPGSYTPGGGDPLPSWNRLDESLLVDRPVLAPDPYTFGNPALQMGNTYPFPSTEDLAFEPASTPGGRGEVRVDAQSGSYETHPFVTVGLRAVGDPADPTVYAASGHAPAGGARFLGTLNPCQRGVNALIPNQGGGPGHPGNPVNVLWSETAVGGEGTLWVFRVIYQGVQPDPLVNSNADPTLNQPNKLVGCPPAFVRVKIYNTVDGSGQAEVKSMTPELPANPATADYMNGVIYKYETRLPKGPHSYSFEAQDSSSPHMAVFPRRPENDDILPVGYGATNSVVNGPYVNNQPVLSNNSVTPSGGISNDTYTYSVLYTDPDGNKPYQADLIVETSTGETKRVAMRRTGGTAYQSGSTFAYSATASAGLVLGQGVRHYYFEFTDDWGRVADANDRIQGETVQFPASVNPGDVSTWFSGPTIAANNAPTLSNPKADSSNGLSTPDSQWTFQVTYSDVENQAPSFIQLLLGKASCNILDAFVPSDSTHVTVTPADPHTPGVMSPKVLDVVGVWTTNTPTTASTNYFTGGTFNPSTGVVTLGTALPNGVSPVYVTYHCTPIDWTNNSLNRGQFQLKKLDTSATNYQIGVVYYNIDPISFPGPSTSSIWSDPPSLYYYSFSAADGLARASYVAAGQRPSTGAFGQESELLSAMDRQNYQLSFGGFAASTRPNPVSPVVVGPLSAGASGQPLVIEDPVFTLTNTVPDPDVVTTIAKGGGAAKTQYRIDYALGTISLGLPCAVTDVVNGTYWFANYLPPVRYNTPPTLSDGAVTPEVGGASTTYTYSVIYRETDGLNGTAPQSVQVVVDGTAHEMSAAVSGTPIYRNGVQFIYQTKLQPNATHTYYFRATDGQGWAVYDALPVACTGVAAGATNTVITATGQTWTPSQFKGRRLMWYSGKRTGVWDQVLDNTIDTLTVSGVLTADASRAPVVGDQFQLAQGRSSINVISPVGAIDGPFINDKPELKHSDGGTGISPSSVRRSDPVTYSVYYRDTDNDAPLPGYPMTWVGSPQWTPQSGIATTVESSVTLVTDSAQSWTPSKFKGQPLTWVTGKRVGQADVIVDNTATTLFVRGRLDSNAALRPEVSDRFAVLETSGTATAIDYTAAVFADDEKAFEADELAGDRIQIVSGAGIGSAFTIAANTAQSVAVSDRLLGPAGDNTPSADPGVAAAGIAAGDSYSLHDYLAGKITLNLNDNGVVSMKFGNSPGWTADEFAGLPLQMMSGNASQKCYTILSNTEDTLQLAQASNLISGDIVQTGDVARIAGLSMEKVSASDNDYTVYTGVAYRAIVPSLGQVGIYSALWRAANSPVVDSQTVTMQARDPQTAPAQGPYVAGQVPPGNVAPVLEMGIATPTRIRTTDNVAFSVRYEDAEGDPPGPHDGVSGYIQLVVDAEVDGQPVRRVYRSSVDPVGGGSWPKNTFRTIDSTVFNGFLIDASVTPLPVGTHRFHFEASDGWQVTRYPADPNLDPFVVVNSKPILTVPVAGGVTPTQGNAGTPFTFRVIYSDADNKAPSAINVELVKDGVAQAPIPMTQEDVSDVNYIDGATFVATTTLAPGNYTYRFTASDELEAASPTQPQTGPVVRATNAAPVLLTGAVSPATSAKAGNSFTYTVRYRDPDGDAPAAVQVRIFDTDGITILDTKDMTPSVASNTAYSSAEGVEYRLAGYSFAGSGTFSYQFLASDGLAAATGDVAKKTGPVVNAAPVLAGGTVDPVGGLSSDLFTFDVNYSDPDGVSAAGGYVRVALTKGSTTTKYDMHVKEGSGGAVYELQTQLPAGTYSYHFEASDGLDPAANTLETGGLLVTAAPELRDAAVSPLTGKSTDTFTYTVTLSNPDGTAPTEVKVFIDGSADANGHDMTKVNPSDTSYASGVRYQYQTSLASGAHTWFIRAKMAGITVYPAGQAGGTAVPDQPLVNNAPLLTNATVSPTFGRPGEPFTFQVRYSDADGVGPTADGYVRVRVSGVTAPIVLTTAGNTWTDGVVYTASTTLPGGAHTFYFEASDGIEAVRLPQGLGTFDGPRVSSAPTLTSGRVSPLTGTTSTTFVYNVVYTDAENDAPAAGSVKVLIDGQPFTMTKVLTSDTNYTDGASFVYSGRLSAGTHTYAFQASDGVDLVATAAVSGPVVSATGLTLNATPNPVALGSRVTLSGELAPARVAALTLSLTRPDGTVSTRSLSTDSAGRYSTTLVADQVGEWQISISETGSSVTGATLTPALTVQPATLRVQSGVVDMISSPVITESGDPADIFGRADALSLGIVRFDPLTNSYKFYGSATDFPVLTAGSGFWIRPTATKTLSLTGTLSDQTAQIAVPVLPGWNQIGSGFVQSVAWGSTKVRYNGSVVSLAEAAANNWVRDYVWGYHPETHAYFLVRASGGESTVLDPFRGYWIRAFVSCDLLIQPPSQ